jgi:hypothetical protein
MEGGSYITTKKDTRRREDEERREYMRRLKRSWRLDIAVALAISTTALDR